MDFFSFAVPVLSNDGVATRIENLLCGVGLADGGAAGAALSLLEFATHFFAFEDGVWVDVNEEEGFGDWMYICGFGYCWRSA